jgi:hypothetical protein
VLLLAIAAEFIVAILHPLGAFRNWGGDYSLYMEATRRWLGGGSFYQPWQLSGSYDVNFVPGDRGSTAVLYPPASLALFVPFAVLPAVLWWAVPIAFTLYVVWRERPQGWAWTGILTGIASPSSWFIVANGNPALWVLAFIAGGVIWRWPSVLVLLKFSLAPFALVGIRSRGWWVGLAGLMLVSIVLLPLTLEYVAVLLNMRGQDWSYSLSSFPMMMIPLWARLGSSTRN